MRIIAQSFTGLGLLFLFSCSATKYAHTPSTINQLHVEGKNDMKAAVNYATSSPAIVNEQRFHSNGIDVQTVYGLSRRIAVKLDGFYKGENNQSNATQNGIPKEKITYRRSGINLAAGCYNFSKSKDRSSFQLFAGMGLGRTSFTGRYTTGNPDNHYNMKYFNAYIQPSYTFFFSEKYHLSFTGRMNVVDFSNVETDYDFSNVPIGYIDTKPSIFLDFCMTHQFAFNKMEKIKFQVQWGLSSLTTRFSHPQDIFVSQKYDHSEMWFAAGVIAGLGKMLAKTKD